MVTLSRKDQHFTLFLCLPGIMRVVVWTTTEKEFHGGGKFSSSQVLRSERKECDSPYQHSTKGGWDFALGASDRC